LSRWSALTILVSAPFTPVSFGCSAAVVPGGIWMPEMLKSTARLSDRTEM
jgi:hypothetical protein